MSAQAAYTYDAWLPDGLASIHDGDTLHAGIDLGLNVAINETIRFYGVNAPELATAAGKASLAWVQQWFTTNCPNGKFVLTTVRDAREKYGRYLGIIFAPGGIESLNDALVAAGQAVPYAPRLEAH
jgi:endonuclease YncB( thermonuclease family)